VLERAQVQRGLKEEKNRQQSDQDEDEERTSDRQPSQR